MAYRIVVLQDQETYDLLEECCIVELSEEDYIEWCEGSGDMTEIEIVKDGHTTDTITVNKGKLIRKQD